MGNPELVRAVGGEVPIHQVRRRAVLLVAPPPTLDWLSSLFSVVT